MPLRPASLGPGATERRIDIGIVLPEPVAERRPQQFARRGRRCPFHDEMLVRRRSRRSTRGTTRSRGIPETARTPCSSIPIRCRRDPPRPTRWPRRDGCPPARDPSSRSRIRRDEASGHRRPRDTSARLPGIHRPRAGTRPPSGGARRAIGRTQTASARLTYTGHDAGSGIKPNIPRQNQCVSDSLPEQRMRQPLRLHATASRPPSTIASRGSRRPPRTRETARWSHRAARSRSPARRPTTPDIRCPSQTESRCDRRPASRGPRERGPTPRARRRPPCADDSPRGAVFWANGRRCHM